MAKLMFHVRHVSKPEYLKGILHVLANYQPVSSVERLYERARELGLSVGASLSSIQSFKENPMQTGRDLDLIDSEGVALTKTGRLMQQLIVRNEEIADNVFHFLFYDRWVSSMPAENCFSWTYRMFINELWEGVRVDIDKKRYAILLANRAKEEFMTRFDLSPKVSLSANSINGILNWLEVLEPSCIEKHNKVTTFTRRTFCPPELMILAIDFLSRQRNADYGTNLFFSEENIETICKVCLLEPNAFDSVLEWTIGQFDYLLEGRGGGWGRGIILYQKPKLEDFLR